MSYLILGFDWWLSIYSQRRREEERRVQLSRLANIIVCSIPHTMFSMYVLYRSNRYGDFVLDAWKSLGKNHPSPILLAIVSFVLSSDTSSTRMNVVCSHARVRVNSSD